MEAAKLFTPRRAAMLQQSSIACHSAFALLDFARSLEQFGNSSFEGIDCLSCFHSSASASQYSIKECSISVLATAACSRDMASNAENCFLEYIDFPFVTQPRAQRLAQEKLQRQNLYKEFTETASKCYINALQYDKADTPALVELYVRVGTQF